MARLVKYCPLILYEVELKIKSLLVMKNFSSFTLLKAFLNVDENIFSAPWGRTHEDDLKQTKVILRY